MTKTIIIAAALLSISFSAFSAERKHPILPDPNTTPGVVATTDVNEICSVVGGLTYSKRHRHTAPELKRKLRKRDHAEGVGEIDHRCMLAVGCADDERNLWWEPGPDIEKVWNFKVKDKLEDYLYQSVCHTHIMTPKQAQSVLLDTPDWRIGYCKYIQDPTRCENGKPKD